MGRGVAVVDEMRIVLCVFVHACVFWRPQVRTKIMTSFLFSFAETLFFHNSLFIKASIRLSIPPPSLLSSNFAPSLLKSQRSHLHPNRQEHTQKRNCLSQTHRHGGRCHGFVFFLFFIKQHFRTTSSES